MEEKSVLLEVQMRELTQLDSLKLKNPVCIQGMPGIALAGKTAVDFLIKNTNAVKVAEIYSADFPPNVKVTLEGRLLAPACGIYVWKNDKLENDFIFISGEWQPTSVIGMNMLSDFVARTVVSMGAKMVIALAASPIDEPTLNPKVYVTGTSNEIISFVTSRVSHVQVLREGVITGMNGLVPIIASTLYGADGLIFLGEACYMIDRLVGIPKDPAASKALVDVICKLFNLDINTSALHREAERVVKLAEAMKRRFLQAERRVTRKVEERKPPEYIS
ncbi:MAG: PAC2 family protein [Candidatus Baldrarchaeia archaeon]